MKKSLGIIMAAATAFSLSACNDDQGTPETAPGVDVYDPERLISLDIPVTRNSAVFSVSVNAYCNTVSKNQTYAKNCSAAATQAMKQKFMCDSFALAASNTRSNNEAVIGAGLQGRYEEFPREYLFTQKELETKAALHNREFNKENFFVITAISDLDAASVNFTDGIKASDTCDPA